MCGLPQDHEQLTRDLKKLREKWSFLSQKLRTANSVQVGVWPADCLSRLAFGLAWTRTGLVHAVATAMNSHVQMPSSIQKTLLPCSYLSTPDPIFFLAPVHRALGGKRRGYAFHIQLSIVQPLVLCTLARMRSFKMRHPSIGNGQDEEVLKDAVVTIRKCTP